MKKGLKNIGILLIFIGILLFLVSSIAGWSNINGVQLSALALVVGGAALHVINIKRESEY